MSNKEPKNEIDVILNRFAMDIEDDLGLAPLDHESLNSSYDHAIQSITTLLEQSERKARIEEVERMPRADYTTVDEYIDNRISALKGEQ